MIIETTEIERATLKPFVNEIERLKREMTLVLIGIKSARGIRSDVVLSEDLLTIMVADEVQVGGGG